MRGHRVEAVGDGENPGTEGNLPFGEAVGVTATIPAFVMVAHDIPDRVGEGECFQHLGAEGRMHLDPLHLASGQPPGLGEDRLRHGDLADVMQQRGRGECVQFMPLEFESISDRQGQGLDAPQVFRRRRVVDGDRPGQRAADRAVDPRRLLRALASFLAATDVRAMGDKQQVQRGQHQHRELQRLLTIEQREAESRGGAQYPGHRGRRTGHEASRGRRAGTRTVEEQPEPETADREGRGENGGRGGPGGGGGVEGCHQSPGQGGRGDGADRTSEGEGQHPVLPSADVSPFPTGQGGADARGEGGGENRRSEAVERREGQGQGQQQAATAEARNREREGAGQGAQGHQADGQGREGRWREGEAPDEHAQTEPEDPPEDQFRP